ncbi:hypothetical protein SAY86_027567 [Trapa natans]|uniref:Transducin family protein / WD-40 repeat family protein n=1 Tax=Trapa natans TaxID=22666 RepID=A0AAN7KUP5_TRANT|nr:hypothetical protein SAY86_027567 [Trapa natans]
MSGLLFSDLENAPSSLILHHDQQFMQAAQAVPGQTAVRLSGTNVFKILAHREVSPRTKYSPKKLWRELSVSSLQLGSGAQCDARRSLISWVEAESLHNLSAKYCPLLPPPRSTIAAAFSPDGKTLASTHGDHTVKIIDCQTGSCLKVLIGHRRTPWVVRFHPLYSEILASGSLDHEVRLWDANTTECIRSHGFYRPISSIAFHAQGELLAVASGHKLYIWHYNQRGEASSPSIILRTRRSLRAVHFHPHAAPFLLTAEVNDLDSSDSSMTLATSPGYFHYPPAMVYFADARSSEYYSSSLANELPLMSSSSMIWPSFGREDGRISVQHIDGGIALINGQQRVDLSASVRLLTYSTPSGQYELLFSPIESNNPHVHEEIGTNTFPSEVETQVYQSALENVDAMDVQTEGRSNQHFPFSDSRYWELPFLQGWLIGQAQAGTHAGHQQTDVTHAEHQQIARTHETPSVFGNVGSLGPSSTISCGINPSCVSGRPSSRYRSSHSRAIPSAGTNEGPVYGNNTHDMSENPVVNRLRSELAAAASTELPCTVKLRIWPHDPKDPCAPLDSEKCRLMIPHAVLCSEMGAHFSPCGRFLAACVACRLPQLEPDNGLHSQVNQHPAGADTSPTRHPISAHQVVYELRIYSLEEATFGLVLASRRIRAAHCLTSIQFSPTSEHLLLAYGRRHNTLLKSVVVDGETAAPVYTILEVYRISDMTLVRVLPSAEDEVNVACFHPLAGGGLVYGTKEGKLRILQYDSSCCMISMVPDFLDENFPEILVADVTTNAGS